MRATHFSMIVVISLIAAGCGGEAEPASSENIGDSIAAEVAERTGAAPATSAEPCEILDDDLLRAHFEIAPEAEISRNLSKYSSHPLCTVSWEKADAAELQKQRQAAMTEYLTKKSRGEEAKMPSFRTSNEVTLTLYEPVFDDAGAARRAFESLTRRLSEGVTASHENVEMTFQADLTDVAGVGDEAKWAPKLRQLSVVDERRIFHLGVNTGADLDRDREKAEAIAHAIADVL